MLFYSTNFGWSLCDTTVLNERNNESRTGCKLSLKNWNKRNNITILLLNGNMEANSALSIIFYHAISWSIKTGYKLPESYILRMLKMNMDRWYIIGKLYGFQISLTRLIRLYGRFITFWFWHILCFAHRSYIGLHKMFSSRFLALIG